MIFASMNGARSCFCLNNFWWTVNFEIVLAYKWYLYIYIYIFLILLSAVAAKTYRNPSNIYRWKPYRLWVVRVHEEDEPVNKVAEDKSKKLPLLSAVAV